MDTQYSKQIFIRKNRKKTQYLYDFKQKFNVNDNQADKSKSRDIIITQQIT